MIRTLAPPPHLGTGFVVARARTHAHRARGDHRQRCWLVPASTTGYRLKGGLPCAAMEASSNIIASRSTSSCLPSRQTVADRIPYACSSSSAIHFRRSPAPQLSSLKKLSVFHSTKSACKQTQLPAAGNASSSVTPSCQHTTSAPNEAHGEDVSFSEYRFDFVVIGSGIAGLRYALDVAECGSVAVITKAEPHETNTNYAQGGISAVLDPLDSVENHIQDTIVAGAYLCDQKAVEVVCREGPDRVKELITMGALFDQSENGHLHLAREGGHSHHRIVHAADMTGREIERALLTTVRRNPKITFFEHHFALDLLTQQEGEMITCYGVDTLEVQTGKVKRFISGVTMLASGGAGHIYPITTNPLVATGDGVAMADRAGAVISDMEFVQFHPTALADEGLPKKPANRDNAFLVTEAVRGAGGILYNQAMERFMPSYDHRAELAPRDVVARSIHDQMKKRKEKFVYLNISHKPKGEILSHFPSITAECLKYGLDITQQPIPVVPAAHYICGGVQTGLQGETSIAGLYAAGEVACTGLHGANRLGSNSMLEALVFAQRAVKPAVDYVQKVGGGKRARNIVLQEWPRRPIAVPQDLKQLHAILDLAGTKRKALQMLMWEYVGLIRSRKSLHTVHAHIAELELDFNQQLRYHGWKPNMVHDKVFELRNLIAVANLVVRGALSRQESRGSHYVIDFPELRNSGTRSPTPATAASPNSLSSV